MKSKNIKIRSLQAASVYRVNHDYKYICQNGTVKDCFLDVGEAVLNDSILSKYALKHGVTVNSRNMSYDFVMMKFDYGVDGDACHASISSDELRKDFYENGVDVTWLKYDLSTGKQIGIDRSIHYKMLCRNPGKAKSGHCLFVREELYENMINFLTMGLWNKIPDNEPAKIVELSAYSPLISATALDYLKIPIDSIFVLKDEEVSIRKKACIVKKGKDKIYRYAKKPFPEIEKLINEKGYTFYKSKADDSHLTYIGRTKQEIIQTGVDYNDCWDVQTDIVDGCVVEETDDAEITNILWDGEGLIDESIFPDGMNGFVYCRNHFLKSCLFRASIKKYFKDYYKSKYDNAYVTDMFGRKIKVSDIKMIVTDNSLKWLKFVDLMSKSGTKEDAFPYWQKFVEKHSDDGIAEFEIVKTAHKSKYGNLQRTSFQMNNTLLSTDWQQLTRIAQTSIDYINKLKTDDDAFLDYLRITSAKYNINRVLIDLCAFNNKFINTDYYAEKKRNIIYRLKDWMKKGKLFQEGDNLTICGNPLAMLIKVVGGDPLRENCFSVINDGIQCYTERFSDGERLAGFRSPHNSPNNIVHLYNVYPDELIKYFPNLGDGVIVLNGIHTDIQSRANGMDMDSDCCLITNQPDIVLLAREAYLKCPTIINAIPHTSNQYKKNMSDFAKMDSSISQAQYAVGSTSNQAQLALSYWFDGGCQNDDLRDVYIICSVLAQTSIDAAKRSFDISERAEFDRLTSYPCMRKSNERFPQFYADVQKYKYRNQKNKISIKDTDIRFYNCPMDILYRIIDKNVVDMRRSNDKKKLIDIESVLLQEDDYSLVNRKQTGRLIESIREYQKQVDILDMDLARENYKDDKIKLYSDLMDDIKRLKIKKPTMNKLIHMAFSDAKIRDNLLIALYEKDRDMFMSCFKKS